MIRYCNEIGSAAHVELMRYAKPGMMEYQVRRLRDIGSELRMPPNLTSALTLRRTVSVDGNALGLSFLGRVLDCVHPQGHCSDPPGMTASARYCFAPKSACTSPWHSTA